MDATINKQRINKILVISLILMVISIFANIIIYAFFRSENLFMDCKSYKELLEAVNSISDAVKESNGFISTEYIDEKGIIHTETIVLGKFKPSLVGNIEGVSTWGLTFDGYVFFLERTNKKNHKLFVRKYDGKNIENCFEDTKTNQSNIVNSLINGIEKEGVLLSDSISYLSVQIDESAIGKNTYDVNIPVKVKVVINSKWAVFGRRRTETETVNIKNKVESIKIPYIGESFYCPAICKGNIDLRNNDVSWKEYYSKYEKIVNK